MLPETRPRTLGQLSTEVELGRIQIPRFQRDFVWTTKKSAALLDSILKGYPVGTFTFWRTNERLRSIRNLGGTQFQEPKEGETVYYVLDGQQRLTSLIACQKGLTVEREDKKKGEDLSKIYINLRAGEHEQIVVTEPPETDASFISVVDLLNLTIVDGAKYPPEYHEKLQRYREQINAYQFTVVEISDVTTDIATEIFTRINVEGKALTLFEIMVAKTFDDKRNFDLSEKYRELLDKLEPRKYETISGTTVLQTVSVIISGECRRQNILQLPTDDFIATWDEAVGAIEYAVDYFRSHGIPVSQLLPYQALIVPFSFFFKHKSQPTGNQQNYLQDFFWRCSLSGHYSSSVESKLAQDIKRIEAILDDKLPSYDWPIDSSPDFIIQNGEFKARHSYIKAILCIYASYEPKAFNDHYSKVNIGNDWLKQANSRNYHHFFPKAYLQGKKNTSLPNHILNITIVGDFLNKREIGSKPPSQYMAKFANQNSSLSETMRSHLIDDLDGFGVWTDDYDLFFQKRAERVSKEIKSRLISQDIDKNAQPDLPYDSGEEPTAAE